MADYLSLSWELAATPLKHILGELSIFFFQRSIQRSSTCVLFEARYLLLDARRSFRHYCNFTVSTVCGDTQSSSAFCTTAKK